METLKITKEAALTAHENANSKGKALLENLLGKQVFVKNIRERIQNLSDIFELNGTTQEAFNKKWEGFADYEKGQAFEVLIAAAYNPAGAPNFDDGTPKFYPLFDYSGGGFRFDFAVYWRSSSVVGARLLFFGPEARANLLDAVEKFLPQYKQSRTF